ncbi:uncharacterized protein K452DRAFT_292929 [Aplosporella prunicola CBS 121167]|uniref:Uncharacterized protein n=1 Tax=Aplosporella prunicola CBS 121167 TaxID=1176127 RepID=A0A6A6AZC6_9PEZI|nr:uncharacterized protein K452DRAFT_292929 [Aplosporella prunicola CBS 121167]KAF2135821.1 hypothetical protein K452DRAFT_292929 [Aplosporella prunicola CBS 121167]
MKNYTTRHTRPTCDCYMAYVDYDRIIQIIKNGGVPILSVAETENGDISLHVEPRSQASQPPARPSRGPSGGRGGG